jgi:hypothetical protein
MRAIVASVAFSLLLPVAAQAAGAPAAPAIPRTASPAGAKVYFVAPADGDTVSRRFTVRFGLAGMGIAPAGIEFENTGHHHLLVDVADAPRMDYPIPSDATHVHFGKGQTETTLTLAPGKHTLQLLLADHQHIPHDPPVMSTKITVTVK